ncbi:MAG TPA: sialidase family protein [Bryobacteraceae bacterium]|nr:sialidase family protein [Bryobacteraceae bacterium]
MHLLFALSLMALSLGPASNGEPAHEPQLAVRGSTVALAYGAGQSIYFRRSDDRGKTFGAAVEVGKGTVVPLTRSRGPRITFAGSTIVITAVTGKTLAEGPHAHGLPTDGDLVSWRSLDGGKTWSHGTVVNDVPGAPTEGLHSLAADSKGRVFAVWLDKRTGKTQLYGALSTDAGKTWSKNTLIYASPQGTICECCHPSAAFDEQGAIVVMFRNWLSGSRDLYLARSGDGVHFSVPRKLGTGTWKINACPMDGGGVAVSGTGVVTAWRREHSVFVDRPGQPEKEVGKGTDVAIAANARGAYVMWTTPDSIEILTPGATAARALGSKGAFPAVAAFADGGAVAAWESDGRILVEPIR